MTDEKYISIDFKTWETKYVPMEAKLAKAYKELSERKVTIRLVDHTSVWRGVTETELGYLDIEVRKPTNFDINTEYLEYFILNAFQQICSRKNIPTKADVTNIGREVGEKLERMIAIRDSNYKNFAKIPKIIKWLFKIH